MKAVGVREFRNKVTQVLRSRKPILITKYNHPEGVYIPLTSIKTMPLELKREILLAFSTQLAKKLSRAGITEEEILDEFDQIRDHSG